MYGLTERTAIVTGGASGIGRGIVLRLAREGTAVAVFDTDLDRATATANEAGECGVPAKAFRADVSELDSVELAFTGVEQWRGVPDILVNNAGVITIGRVEDTTSEQWRRIFAVNVDGVFHCCKVAVPGMRARGSGKIINISSWYGKQGKPTYSAYSASKAAVIGLTQSLAMELAADGVNVNAVCPGLIFETGLRDYADRVSKEMNLSTGDDRAKAIPMKRVGKPVDIARVVAFLASDEAGYMTGQSLNVTGGLLMH